MGRHHLHFGLSSQLHTLLNEYSAWVAARAKLDRAGVVKTHARQLVDQLAALGVIERPPASRRGIRIAHGSAAVS